MENQQRVVVLGAGGRLAGSLVEAWKGRFHVRAAGRSGDGGLNVADEQAVRRFFEDVDFDWIVNGTGLTNVDRCEEARDEALRVNADAPALLADISSRRKARLLHFSTDYVFDGTEPGPLKESALASPLGWYGETKLRGERAVTECDARHVVVRVSWVFGPHKSSFVDQILARALREERVEAIEDKWSSPTSAEDAASWLAPFLERDLPGGVYHACNAGQCSWREYGQAALDMAAALGWALRARRVDGIPLASMRSFVATRPVRTILDSTKLQSVAGLTLRTWQEALQDYIARHAPVLPAA